MTKFMKWAVLFPAAVSIIIAVAIVSMKYKNKVKAPTPSVTTFIDSRDSTVYKKVTIGVQIWMAENLNYAADGSKCHNDDEANCVKYGRLYDWKTATTVCPDGWRLPSKYEWRLLVDYAGGPEKAGTQLKSSTGWAEQTRHSDESSSYQKEAPKGKDTYGFSALPGGAHIFDDFSSAGYGGDWWSATESAATSDEAWQSMMTYNDEYVRWYVRGKEYFFSVRCVQDTVKGGGDEK